MTVSWPGDIIYTGGIHPGCVCVCEPLQRHSSPSRRIATSSWCFWPYTCCSGAFVQCCYIFVALPHDVAAVPRPAFCTIPSLTSVISNLEFSQTNKVLLFFFFLRDKIVRRCFLAWLRLVFFFFYKYTMSVWNLYKLNRLNLANIAREISTKHPSNKHNDCVVMQKPRTGLALILYPSWMCVIWTGSPANFGWWNSSADCLACFI